MAQYRVEKGMCWAGLLDTYPLYHGVFVKRKYRHEPGDRQHNILTCLATSVVLLLRHECEYYNVIP